MSALENFELGSNFWVKNQSFLVHKLYKDMYDGDKSKSKKSSSDTMWAIAFVADDTEHNKALLNYPPEERIEVVKSDFISDDINFEDYQEHIELYKKITLDRFEKALSKFLDKLSEREKFLNDTPYNIGNAKVLDEILGRTKLLHDLYEDLKDKVKMAKIAGGGITRGSVTESETENKLL